MWCVIEVFVFVTMGGKRGAMAVEPLEEEGSDLGLECFDAAEAQCFLPKDRERLLAVIEASFGTVGPFNAVVRGLMAEKRDEATRRRQRAGGEHEVK